MAKSSAYLKAIFERLPQEELEAFSRLSKSEEYLVLKRALENLIYNTMVHSVQLSLADPNRLAVNLAEYKGIIFGVKMITRIVDESGGEIEKRLTRRKEVGHAKENKTIY